MQGVQLVKSDHFEPKTDLKLRTKLLFQSVQFWLFNYVFCIRKRLKNHIILPVSAVALSSFSSMVLFSMFPDSVVVSGSADPSIVSTESSSSSVTTIINQVTHILLNVVRHYSLAFNRCHVLNDKYLPSDWSALFKTDIWVGDSEVYDVLVAVYLNIEFDYHQKWYLFSKFETIELWYFTCIVLNVNFWGTETCIDIIFFRYSWNCILRGKSY